MGYPTKVQAVKRGKGWQWFINFPAALASAMNFKKSEVFEWEVLDKDILKLKRPKKKRTT